ncbi:MAG: hypothetical protein IPJ88_15315 [Myxococcales bacterium]|nr:MAG: hypothetical protein IPJ88_15315 [Myxococcales bacterium]
MRIWGFKKSITVRLLSALAVVCMFLSSVQVFAQNDPQSAEKRAAAAAAYDRGSKAYVAGDFARAGRFYETAYRLLPSVNALLQTIKAYLRAEDDKRAGTAALALQEEYGVHRMTSDAKEALERAAAKYFRVDLVCEDCEIRIDDEREYFPSIFLSAGDEHTIVASFEDGDREQSVSGEAGEQKVVALVGPSGEEQSNDNSEELADSEESSETPADNPEDSSSSDGLSPVFFWVGAGLTAVALGVTVWSGLDTSSAADEYKKDPTPERYSAGQDLELRTNVLIGVTAGLAVATTVMGVFLTDWNSSNSDDEDEVASSGFRLQASAYAMPGGAGAALWGRF